MQGRGRYAVLNLGAVEKAAGHYIQEQLYHIPTTFEEIVEHRKKFLTDYQNKAYASRYEKLVLHTKGIDQNLKREELSLAVAKYYAKLLAIKDEYEVARLFTDGTFMKDLHHQFEGPIKLKFSLAPPLFAQRDPSTGELKKKMYGPWMMHGFRLLSKFKGLRGTVLDIFSYTKDRKQERSLIKEYEKRIAYLLERVTPQNYDLAVALAALPEHIRGYGHVKDRHLQDVKANEAALLAQFKETVKMAQLT